MKINQLQNSIGSKQKNKRLGRGIGSGKGKTSGRGVKGQKSRSGVSINGFEGGQMPIYRRLPKRGFNNFFKKDFNIISLKRIQHAIDLGKLESIKIINIESLKEIGMIRKNKDGVRILSNGYLSRAMFFEVSGASQKAIEKIKKSGGDIKILPEKFKIL